jgi:alkylation response protein AidB-like acyl-CoA dehydrogenase
MRFALSPEQRQFAETLHDLLVTSDSPGAARSWAGGDPAPGRKLWHRLAEVGVTALAVPQRWDGLGAHPVDLVIACEELGHHALPGPVVESVAVVPTLLTALADERLRSTAASTEASAASCRCDVERLCAEWLPRLAAGDLLATLAAPPRLPYAVDADAAGLVLLAEAGTLSLGEPVDDRRSLDETRRLFRLTASTAGGKLATGATDAIARAFDAGTLACAAQLLGAGRALLDSAVRYAGQRTQFGRPIGAFQAVAHQLSDVLIGLTFARPLLYAAAIAVADGSPTAARDVSAAKVACAGAAHRAARTALQVHGAIGYTREYDLWLWLTKVRALIPAWGTPAEHRARVAAQWT